MINEIKEEQSAEKVITDEDKVKVVYGLIKDFECINAIVLSEDDDIEETKENLKHVYDFDDIVKLEEGFGIGQFYKDNAWLKYDPKMSQSQKRQNSYSTELIIEWDKKMLTVDQANELFLKYFAEGNEKMSEIQKLIASAKEEIRQKYPD